MNRFRIITGLFLLILCARCTQHIAGGSSETETGTLVGVIMDSGGAGVADAVVVARPLSSGALPESDPENSFSTRTDEDGAFIIDAVDTGLCFVEAFDHDAITGVLVAVTIEPDKTTRVNATTEPLGGMRGKIEWELARSEKNSVVFLPEVGRVIETDENGVFDVSGLPPFDYSVRVMQNGIMVASYLDTRSVAVEPARYSLVERPIDTEDHVLVIHRLTPEQSSQYSGKDNLVSPFWAQWEGKDYVHMTPSRNALPGRDGFYSETDAALTLKAAGDENGIYLLVEITDDWFLAALKGDSAWNTDAVELFFDVVSSDALREAGENLSFRPEWSLSKSSKQFQVWNGCLVSPNSFRFSQYSHMMSAWISGKIMFKDAPALVGSNLQIEVIAVSERKKAQEWFIPWTFFKCDAEPGPGRRFAMAGGYDDKDPGNLDVPKCLRWTRSDPMTARTNGEYFDSWGDLEAGIDFLYE